MIFLLQYDRREGTVRKLKPFPSTERVKAQRERLKIELSLHKAHVPHEVVLLEAADEQTLKRTHQRYFKTPRELMESMSQP
jgi:hypothetical protein